MSSLQNAKNRIPVLLRTVIGYSTAKASASPRTYPKGKKEAFMSMARFILSFLKNDLPTITMTLQSK